MLTQLFFRIKKQKSILNTDILYVVVVVVVLQLLARTMTIRNFYRHSAY